MAKRAFQLREKFIFPPKHVAHYFPWHMQKGLRKLMNRLRDVDCLLEVHDARIPLSGRNPIFKETAEVRPHLLLLNKIDLADTSHKEIIVQKLQENGVNEVLFTNCKSDKNALIKVINNSRISI